jgi:hydrogenase nickel incorporation protein HypA/HybF
LRGAYDRFVHEAAIVQELITLAAERKPPRTRVIEVHVSVGLLTGVSPEAMRFYFEALCEEVLGRQARLEVRLEPLRAVCRACGLRATLDEARWVCGACGEAALTFENGEELDLTNLVVDDGEPDHDRAEDPQEERRHRPGEPPGA